MQDGEVTDATPDRALGADREGAAGQGRQGRRRCPISAGPRASASARCRCAPLCAAARRRRWAARGRVRRGLHRRAGRARGRRAASRATCCCSRTCASIRARRRTIRRSPISSPRLGELYVDDAFSAAHRAHASITGLAERLPCGGGPPDAGRDRGADPRARASRAAGRRAGRRRQGLDQARAARQPDRARSTTWSSAAAWPTPSCSPRARRSADRCARRTWPTPRARSWPRPKSGGCQIAAADRRPGRAASSRPARRPSVVPIELVPDDAMILDVGPAARAADRAALARQTAAPLVWNGPLGAFEIPPFDAGTTARGAAGRRADPGRQADERRRRRRHARRAGARRRARPALLRLDRRRRLPRMAGRQGAAGRRGAARGSSDPRRSWSITSSRRGRR